MKRKLALGLLLTAISFFLLLSLAGEIILAQTPTPEAGPSSTPATTAGATTPQEGEEPRPTPTGLLDEVVVTRTPAPTATPGFLSQEVAQLATRAGFYQAEFLGIKAIDWINLGISLVIVLFGYLLGTWLIRRVLPRVVKRTPSTFDDQLLDRVGPELRWIVVLVVLNYSTTRLVFLAAPVKTVLSDIYFVIGLAISVRIVFRLIDLADAWYRDHPAREGRLDGLDPLLTLMVRLGRVLVGVVGLIILLSHFGINVSAFAAALGLGGLAFSLAARDTIADAIAGFIILVDQPFRIGDRIEIQEVDTWGDVTDIGLRTTRIRTRDNRMVIVPNSIIGSNQVINYSYPDPQYRIETHVSLGYGTDIEHAREVLIDTVRRVQGVLADKPVDALYIEMGPSAMIFRVRWWIESYVDTRRMFDRVHTALQVALDEAGIESPFPTQTLNVHLEPGSTDQHHQEPGDPG